MARALGEPPSNVAAWKRVGRIPAEKQPHVLEVALANGLPVTAEDVVYPLGHRPDPLSASTVGQQADTVACDRRGKLQPSNAA